MMSAVLADRERSLAFRHAESWRFWWQHLRWPLAAFCVLGTVFATTSLDHTIAHAVFYRSDPSRWIGAHSALSNEILHTGGQWLVRCLVAIALALFAVTFTKRGLVVLRRPAGYFAAAVILSVGIVGLGKSVSPVHCPWSLAEFGGTQPSTLLFSQHPASVPAGHCFPAGHSSAGYALMALYFVFLERGARLARIGLLAGLAVGLIFGIAQQSRGAHFISHDLWSAMIAWLACLTLYTFAFGRRLWPATGQGETNEPGAAAMQEDNRSSDGSYTALRSPAAPRTVW